MQHQFTQYLLLLLLVVVVIVFASSILQLLKKLVKDVQNHLMPGPSLITCHQCNIEKILKGMEKTLSQNGKAG